MRRVWERERERTSSRNTCGARSDALLVSVRAWLSNTCKWAFAKFRESIGFAFSRVCAPCKTLCIFLRIRLFPFICVFPYSLLYVFMCMCAKCTRRYQVPRAKQCWRSKREKYTQRSWARRVVREYPSSSYRLYSRAIPLSLYHSIQLYSFFFFFFRYSIVLMRANEWTGFSWWLWFTGKVGECSNFWRDDMSRNFFIQRFIRADFKWVTIRLRYY